MKAVKTVKTSCRNCHGGCGALVTVEDGVVTKIAPNPDSPLSGGRMCPKGVNGLELLYHPDRLNYPMKRAGARGEGKWERISWDEAYDIIAEKVTEIEKDYGMQSVGVVQGTGRHHFASTIRFANSLGTPTWFEPGTAQCFFPRVNLSKAMFGFVGVVDYYSDVTPGCILVWGSNPANSGADCESQFRFKDAVQRGAKVIVVDPQENEVAENADVFLQLRPGTDDAMALGMLNVIIGENLYDKEFVETYCYGFEELAERVKEYPVERVAAITEVDAALIVKAARMFALSSSATLEWGCAIEHSPNCTQTIRAIACLPAITGNIDKKGGFIEGMQIMEDPADRGEQLSQEMRKIRLGADQYRILAGAQNGAASAHIPTVFEAIKTGKPYPIKALLLCGNNGVSGFADSKDTYETLKNVDFICAQDLFMTPTISLLADLVLPAACWLESDNLYSGPFFADHAIIVQKAVIPPLYERKQDEQIFIELLKRLGKSYGVDTVDELLETQLELFRWWYPEYRNLTLEQLREMGHLSVPVTYEKFKDRAALGEKPFATKTGKIELRSTMMEKLGYDPLPYYEEPPESPRSQPELFKEYPLVLTTGTRSPFSFISENRQMPSLRRSNPFPMVHIHTVDAAKYGIQDGDWVYIETPRGRITQKAQVDGRIKPGTVNCQMGWWFPERKGDPTYGVFDVNCNVLTSRNPPYDPAMGTYQLRGLLCRISKNTDGVPYERDFQSWLNAQRRTPDESTNSIVIDPNLCIECGNCVYVCSKTQGIGALEIATTETGTMVRPAGGKTLADTACVGCGQCAKVCPTGAITVKSKLDHVREAIADRDTITAALVAPSVRVGMSGQLGGSAGENTLGKVICLLHRMGFDKVYDVSFGADLTIIAEGNEIKERLAAGKNLPLLTSCCPAWVKFCESQLPEFKENISTCRSPHQMLGAVVRNDFRQDPAMKGKKLVVVSIMPCSAKKDEILREESRTDGVQDVDYVVDTAELVKLIERQEVDTSALEEDCADAPYSLETGSGVLFGASGGVMESALRYLTQNAADARQVLKDSAARGKRGVRELSLEIGGRTVRAAITSGLASAKALLERVKSGEAQYDVIEVMACPGGCIMGGGQPPYDYYFAQDSLYEGLKGGVLRTDEEAEVTEASQNPQAFRLFEGMSGEERHRLLHRNLPEALRAE